MVFETSKHVPKTEKHCCIFFLKLHSICVIHLLLFITRKYAIPIHLHEMATNSTKIHLLALKNEHYFCA